jgi:hypothetical protein
MSIMPVSEHLLLNTAEPLVYIYRASSARSCRRWRTSLHPNPNPNPNPNHNHNPNYNSDPRARLSVRPRVHFGGGGSQPYERLDV